MAGFTKFHYDKRFEFIFIVFSVSTRHCTRVPAAAKSPRAASLFTLAVKLTQKIF
jgi:hypothetical protein